MPVARATINDACFDPYSKQKVLVHVLCKSRQWEEVNHCAFFLVLFYSNYKFILLRDIKINC